MTRHALASFMSSRRRPGSSRCLVAAPKNWIPACAGMTVWVGIDAVANLRLRRYRRRRRHLARKQARSDCRCRNRGNRRARHVVAHDGPAPLADRQSLHVPCRAARGCRTWRLGFVRRAADRRRLAQRRSGQRVLEPLRRLAERTDPRPPRLHVGTSGRRHLRERARQPHQRRRSVLPGRVRPRRQLQDPGVPARHAERADQQRAADLERRRIEQPDAGRRPHARRQHAGAKSPRFRRRRPSARCRSSATSRASASRCS